MNIFQRFWAWLEPRLVNDWRRAWKFASVWVNLAIGALASFAAAAPQTIKDIWNSLPDDLRSRLPGNFGLMILGTLAFLAIVLRVLKKKTPDAQ